MARKRSISKRDFQLKKKENCFLLAKILIKKSIAYHQGIEHEIPLGMFWFTSIFNFHIKAENRPKFGGSKILVPKIKFRNVDQKY